VVNASPASRRFNLYSGLFNLPLQPSGGDAVAAEAVAVEGV
jgi:hypothetical protein